MSLTPHYKELLRKKYGDTWYGLLEEIYLRNPETVSESFGLYPIPERVDLSQVLRALIGLENESKAKNFAFTDATVEWFPDWEAAHFEQNEMLKILTFDGIQRSDIEGIVDF